MICIPITAGTTDAALRDIDNAAQYANIIELRADFIKEPDIRRILRHTKKKIIVTNRKKSESGRFNGTEEQRIGILKKAINLGAGFVDIELSSGKRAIEDLIANKKNSKVIVSYHNFKNTPKNLAGIYNEIKKTGCDIIKIATFAESINDNLAIFGIIKMAKRAGKKIIALCMGPRGEISRILSPLIGAELTFGSLGEGKESAPGQTSAKMLQGIYRINELKGKNLKIYGLAGNPVVHSKGILIHNAAFKKLGMNSIYLNFLVDDINSFVRNYKGIIGGLSVTIPFKKEIIGCIDKMDAAAKSIGAVNTVVKRGGRLIGANTDYIAAINSLRHRTEIKNKKVAIIGAGGAARAIAFGITNEGGKLTVLNRTISKAKKLAEELKCGFGGISKLEKLKCDIIINCTSVGMWPDINKSPVKNKKILKNMVVFDTIYNPDETKLLRDARKNGCKTISGAEMFIGQAAEQFRLWTGKRMPVGLAKEIISSGDSAGAV